jgi:hypothetical protein
VPLCLRRIAVREPAMRLRPRWLAAPHTTHSAKNLVELRHGRFGDAKPCPVHDCAGVFQQLPPEVMICDRCLDGQSKQVSIRMIGQKTLCAECHAVSIHLPDYGDLSWHPVFLNFSPGRSVPTERPLTTYAATLRDSRGCAEGTEQGGTARPLGRLVLPPHTRHGRA